MNEKIIFITGLTASGKSDLAINLAKNINGEIINADSRQVYKYLDWGSGKIDIKNKREIKISNKKFIVCYSKEKNIPHYLISQVHPKFNYSLGKWLKDVDILVEYLRKKEKRIIICGGTILYLKAIKEGWILPKVKPDYKLRKELDKFDNNKLFNYLLKLDQNRALSIDKHNKVRLIRAIEIALKKDKVPPLLKKPKYDLLILAPNFNWFELEAKIRERLEKRSFKIIKEIIKLRKIGLGFERIINFGLEYKWFGLLVKNLNLKNVSEKKFYQSIINLPEYKNIFESCYRNIRRFARKQLRELNKFENINWVKNNETALNLVNKFLN